MFCYGMNCFWTPSRMFLNRPFVFGAARTAGRPCAKGARGARTRCCSTRSSTRAARARRPRPGPVLGFDIHGEGERGGRGGRLYKHSSTHTADDRVCCRKPQTVRSTASPPFPPAHRACDCGPQVLRLRQEGASAAQRQGAGDDRKLEREQGRGAACAGRRGDRAPAVPARGFVIEHCTRPRPGGGGGGTCTRWRIGIVDPRQYTS